jgi:iron complex outermembrane receptor protein
MIQQSNVTSNGVFIVPAPPYPEIPSDQQNLAVNSYLFTEWNVLLPSDVTVTVGGSLNKDAFIVQNMLVGGKLFDTTSAIKKPFGADFTPRISVSKTFAKMVSVFGDISGGYTPPLLSEVVASNGTIDPYLKPEQAVQYELGARGSFFDRRLTGELTFYDLDNTNKLISETLNSVTYTTNIGEQRNEGIEASLSYLVVESPDQFLSRVRPWVSYTLTDAKYVNFKSDNNNDSTTVNYSGNAVARVPRNMVSAGIDAATDNGFYLNTSYQFIDRVPVTFDNSTWVRGFYLLSAKVGYKKMFHGHYLVDVSLGGDNLTGQTNYTFLFVGPTYKGLAQSQDGGSGDGYILPGVPTATVYGGVRLSYVF